MGVFQAFYGQGGILGSTIFTAILNSGRRWNICYSVLIAMADTSIVVSTVAFWSDTAAV